VSESPDLTKAAPQQFVVSLRQRGIKPVSCNTCIKGLNAFCLWAHEKGHLTERLHKPFKTRREPNDPDRCPACDGDGTIRRGRLREFVL
jgi:hypothetical protein